MIRVLKWFKDREDVLVEMVLYDVRSNKRIWSALSRTYIRDTGVEVIKPAASRIVEMLAAEKIIPS